jgi:hypothetical protein
VCVCVCVCLSVSVSVSVLVCVCRLNVCGPIFVVVELCVSTIYVPVWCLYIYICFFYVGTYFESMICVSAFCVYILLRPCMLFACVNVLTVLLFLLCRFIAYLLYMCGDYTRIVCVCVYVVYSLFMYVRARARACVCVSYESLICRASVVTFRASVLVCAFVFDIYFWLCLCIVLGQNIIFYEMLLCLYR